jgi:hypothetical protein
VATKSFRTDWTGYDQRGQERNVVPLACDGCISNLARTKTEHVEKNAFTPLSASLDRARSPVFETKERDLPHYLMKVIKVSGGIAVLRNRGGWILLHNLAQFDGVQCLLSSSQPLYSIGCLGFVCRSSLLYLPYSPTQLSFHTTLPQPKLVSERCLSHFRLDFTIVCYGSHLSPDLVVYPRFGCI